MPEPELVRLYRDALCVVMPSRDEGFSLPVIEAMAAGGLRHFKAGPVEIKLDQPADLAVWRDAKGVMQGVLQDYQGPVPADLAALTSNWLRLELPPRLNKD